MGSIFEEYRGIIPGFSEFQEAVSRPQPAHLRINNLKTSTRDLIASLEAKGISVQREDERFENLLRYEGDISPGNLIHYFLGHIHPQAFTSCLASLALAPAPDSMIADLCASPGGKTSHMAQLVENSGIIVANELYSIRHVALGNTLGRLGVLNTAVTSYQAQEFPLRTRFDFILADVPCSGEGRFRKSAEGDLFTRHKDESRILELQKRIILRAFDLLKEDGIMLYSTCTYNPLENEAAVDYLLKNRPARVLPFSLGPYEEEGIAQWREISYENEVTNCRRYYPHRIDSVGFFMARIGRR